MSADLPTRPSRSDDPGRPPSDRGPVNPVRGPFNSWFLALLDGYVEARLGSIRDALVADLRGADEIVEIGPGNGPLFRRLRPGTRVHAIEPNPAFHRRLRASAREHGVDLVLHTRGAETIDLPDDHVDAVVCTWVLCTVEDPARVLAEVARILRPGGRFAFNEHVVAPAGSAVRVTQRAVQQPWAWLFEGCRTDRDTAALLRAAPFVDVAATEVRVPTSFVPIRTQIAGVATV